MNGFLRKVLMGFRVWMVTSNKSAPNTGTNALELGNGVVLEK